MEDDSKIKVLFMAADPSNAVRLRLCEECELIRKAIDDSKNKEIWQLAYPRLSMQPSHLSEVLLRHKPHFVHFSGHGQKRKKITEHKSSIKHSRKCDKRSRKVSKLPEDNNDLEGIVFEDSQGHARLVSSNALEKMFKCFSNQTMCVILNACHSLNQARVIVNHIPFVIGMSKEIQDQAAIAFSRGFYRALSEKCSIQKSYEIGCAEIAIEGIEGNSTPELKISSNISAFITEIPPHLRFLFHEEDFKSRIKSESSNYRGNNESKKTIYQFVINFELNEENVETVKIVKDIISRLGKIWKGPELTIIDFEIEEDEANKKDGLDA